MFKNYILIVLRNIDKYKGYSLINIFGLSLGITFCLLLLLYIKYELSYDHHHQQADQIYRVATNAVIKDDYFNLATTPSPLGPVLKREYNEIIDFTRLVNVNREMVVVGKNQFFETNFFYADPGVFKLFDFKLIHGDPYTCLSSANGVVISEKLALKYFDETAVVGETLFYSGNKRALKITGVMQNPTPSSHFVPAAFLAYKGLGEERKRNWVNFNDYTYILFPSSYAPDLFLLKLEAVYQDYMDDLFYQFNSSASFFLQPLKDIHLHSKLQAEIAPGGEISYIYIFSAIATFIIIIASINYMNLATARSVKRAKEIGLRKVVGSYKTQLINQFMIESVMFTSFSMVISLIAVKYLIRPFNQIAGKEIDIQVLGSPLIILGLLGIVILVGLLAGSYPAFYLSRVNTVEVLKGKVSTGIRNLSFRRALVVIQFGLSSIMLICTWVVFDQLNYVDQKDLGFTSDQLIRIPLHTESLQRKSRTLSAMFSKEENIELVSSATCTPGNGDFIQSGFYVETDEGEMVENLLLNFNVDENYIPVLNISINAGRNFSSELDRKKNVVIVNQTLVDKMNWDDAIGKEIHIINNDQMELTESKVIGVVDDFHVRSLHKKITPMVLTYNKSNEQLLVKIKQEAQNKTLNFMSASWNNIISEVPFDYSFVDEDLQQYYMADERKGDIFAIFSGITILIACLGLFGLASFTSSQRKKEISIRKINGATISDIIILVTKDYLILIGISILLAWPFAYYFISDWLQNFAYSVSINPSAFILSAVATITITILTISFHATKAALTNPIYPLKLE